MVGLGKPFNDEESFPKLLRNKNIMNLGLSAKPFLFIVSPLSAGSMGVSFDM